MIYTPLTSATLLAIPSRQLCLRATINIPMGSSSCPLLLWSKCAQFSNAIYSALRAPRTLASQSRLKINFAAPSASRGRRERDEGEARVPPFSEIIKEILRSAIPFNRRARDEFPLILFFRAFPFPVPFSFLLFSLIGRDDRLMRDYITEWTARCRRWHNLTLDISPPVATLRFQYGSSGWEKRTSSPLTSRKRLFATYLAV